MSIWICGAQGQMSQGLKGGLWISVRQPWGKVHKSFDVSNGAVDFSDEVEKGEYPVGLRFSALAPEEYLERRLPFRITRWSRIALEC